MHGPSTLAIQVRSSISPSFPPALSQDGDVHRRLHEVETEVRREIDHSSSIVRRCWTEPEDALKRLLDRCIDAFADRGYQIATISAFVALKADGSTREVRRSFGKIADPSRTITVAVEFDGTGKVAVGTCEP